MAIAGTGSMLESYWVSPSMIFVKISKETLSVARDQSRVGGSLANRHTKNLTGIYFSPEQDADRLQEQPYQGDFIQVDSF